jgi:hypothetical protein
MLVGYQLLKATPNEAIDPEIQALYLVMEPLLFDGFAHLYTFKVVSEGYEWFGRDPASEPLSGYALLIFMLYKELFPALVDNSITENLRIWLLSRRNGLDGFLQSTVALDSFGRAPLWTANAYITYALAKSGETTEIDDQVTGLIAHADSLITAVDIDSYEFSLLASSLFILGRDAEAKTYADIVAAH